MPLPSHLPSDFARTLEWVEGVVYRDLYGRATALEAARNRMACTTIGEATVLTAGAVDVLFFNRAFGLGLSSALGDAALDTILDRPRAAGAPRFFVQLSPYARPADLPGRIVRRGLRPYNRWMKLYRATSDPPDARTELRIEPIGRERADLFGRIVAPTFDWPPDAATWLARQVGSSEWRHYFAYDGPDVAAVAAFRQCGEVAYLGPAVTLPLFRRRGAQSALVARRLRDAAALGCGFIVTETAEPTPGHPAPSLRNLMRLGFEVAYARPNYLLTRGG